MPIMMDHSCVIASKDTPSLLIGSAALVRIHIHAFIPNTIILCYAGPPINVAITSRTSQSLTFTWQSPVDPNGRHGDFVRSPVVCYSDDNSRQTTTAYGRSADNQVTFEVEALMPYSYYNCCVSVETTLANSTGVCQSTQTPQDGNNRYAC